MGTSEPMCDAGENAHATLRLQGEYGSRSGHRDWRIMSRMSAEPGAILEGMKKIRKLDRREVPPTANPLRPAEPAPCLTQEEALRNAPEKADGFFAVPRLEG